MRKTTNILLIIVFVGLLDGMMYCSDPRNYEGGEIIKETKDSRGLTSVIYTPNGLDTFSLDYLNKLELDSLKNTMLWRR